jgi:hypothetical protein
MKHRMDSSSDESDESDIDENSESKQDNINNSRSVKILLGKLLKKELKLTTNERNVVKQVFGCHLQPQVAAPRRRNIRDSIRELKQLPQKNSMAYFWSLYLATTYTYFKIEELTVSDILTDSRMFSGIINQMVRNLQDVCFKLNIHHKVFDDMYKKFNIQICVNDSVTVTSALLKTEPIMFVFTPEFIENDTDNNYDDDHNNESYFTKRKRQTYLLVNLNLIRKIYERLESESNNLCNYEAGLISIGNIRNIPDEQQANRRFAKLLMILIAHAIGHFDLFVRFSAAYYDTHKKESQFQNINSIFK